MSSESQKFKLLKREKDTSFNIDSLERYSLFLQFGPNDLQISVLEAEENKVLLVEDYILPGVDGLEDRLECFKGIFNGHHLLMANFWKEIKVSFKTRKFTLVPDHLFESSRTEVCLSLNSTLEQGSESLQVANMNDLGLKIIYAVEEPVLQYIHSTYPRAGFRHFPHCASMILGAKKYLNDAPGTFNCLYIDRFVLHQAVFRDGRFRYYNLFPIKEFDDYARYISMVAADQGIDIENDRHFLWGFISSGSDQFAELKDRFPTVELGSRPAVLKFSHVFDEFEAHQYFELFNLYLL
ncbi:MAG TPA: DUF3822 family protein [Cyclobacteriaceae bacterium]|nr:DUF3822 family protein [Cyclobacteriaceae bacterium]